MQSIGSIIARARCQALQDARRRREQAAQDAAPEPSDRDYEPDFEGDDSEYDPLTRTTRADFPRMEDAL